LFLSGQIGTKLVDGKPAARLGRHRGRDQADVREHQGDPREGNSSLDRVIKCTVMMADMAEWPKMNDIYATFFKGKKPARSAFGATGLALNARVENRVHRAGEVTRH
jgi:enamine deaminase RidA (YjgF/YER057c/UK114 family)